ncbi:MULTISPECIES: DUF4956 domain-containing protein [Streptomyces]|uniref:DUF4956 domain-containing protein n=2 Tax=Streptomyces TaxID=1883 RepID=A0A3R7IMX9_9ACTN|nr:MULTISPECIES: DUF4956 domain-containing protein [Streptomyces]KNE81686.1 permease [Streptomyces fradiae]OFA50001.1 DUF4956 domain-containing protein [Streptomyces fradiae]PQM23562.1 DUF4956 domain-containing protein [Streptomyces xinghaiensis]RKM92226.1 DUF4956 domain-containing protein [Streptomyces xinghaiensis]RNC70197.1 DUF4956 domain-containing protein [Streptomyces xinghaiensis]
MAQPVLFLCDITAVALLVFGLYFPRHRRRDLVVAFLGVNVGVLAVASSLANSGSNTGLGLGMALFGVLSIIRLRSTELDQHEVAYYFSALALGVLGAMATTNLWRSVGLMALILAVLYVGDHPRLFRSYRRQVMVLDTALPDHTALVAHLENTLGTRVHSATVQRLDLVNDTTVVDVRYRSLPTGRGAKGDTTARTGPAPTAGAGASPLTVRP